VIDEAGAKAKLIRNTYPTELKNIEKKLKKLEQEKNLFTRIKDYVRVESIQEEEDSLREALEGIHKGWKDAQEKNVRSLARRRSPSLSPTARGSRW